MERFNTFFAFSISVPHHQKKKVWAILKCRLRYQPQDFSILFPNLWMMCAQDCNNIKNKARE
jgi:hypothetical protein